LSFEIWIFLSGQSFLDDNRKNFCSDDFNLGANYFKKSQIGIKDIHDRAFLHGISLVVTNYNIVEIDKWPLIKKQKQTQKTN
jgi:hypothetical protein